MSPHYKRNSSTYNLQHYKEHLIPINGGRGNLFNEELKVTPGDGEGRRLFCLKKEKQSETLR